MKTVTILAVVLILVPSLALAQAAGENQQTGTPGSAGPSGGRSAVQRSGQPDPGDVRPGNRDGDNPSATTGDLVRKPVEQRIFGLPVTAALLIGGVIVVLLVIAGVVIPATRRRARARGNGTYGPHS
jgi:hypothetical protein